MASIQKKSEAFYCQFLYLGKRYTVTVGKVSKAEAEAFAGKVELLLMRVKQKLIHVPPGVGIVDFVLGDGHVRPVEQPAPEKIEFSTFRQKYLETARTGMEANSLATAEMHLRHFERTLGPMFPIAELELADLQRHVHERRRKRYQGRPLSPVTLKKEMASLRAAWNWGALNKLVAGPFPAKGLVYPKGEEKPPFMTRPEIERRLDGLSEQERDGLWDCLFLTTHEVIDLLDHVKATAALPWVYPAVAVAAHTGARRSEILRIRTGDVDLDGKTLTIREKKKQRGQRTTRRVPLSPFLVAVLADWLKAHPGGPNLFCQSGVVPRSKKRSRTTGHRSKERAGSLEARRATVKAREAVGNTAITRDEAHDHFKRTLAGSKWGVLRGWHVLRHSFISNCAAAGVDQRLIDSWAGHTTEIRKRYLHLIPSNEQSAIGSVFGEQ